MSCLVPLSFGSGTMESNIYNFLFAGSLNFIFFLNVTYLKQLKYHVVFIMFLKRNNKVLFDVLLVSVLIILCLFLNFSGLIGRSWAMLFASGGYNVVMYDSDSKISEAALVTIEQQLNKLEKDELLRGSLSAAEQMKLISSTSDLSECLKDAVHVQVCIFYTFIFKKMSILLKCILIIDSNNR